VKLEYKVLWGKVVKSQGMELEYKFLGYATGMQSFEVQSWNIKFSVVKMEECLRVGIWNAKLDRLLR
jgi:hypothetical protein